MVSTLRLQTLAIALMTAVMASAQCAASLDITLIPNQENQLEVWLRPQDDFNEFFSSIVFTIKWLDGGGAGLGAIIMEPPFSGLGTSGPEHVNGIYRYQIYSGIDVVNFAGLPEMFEANVATLLTRISLINGTSAFFEIADDDFTESVNGTYYVSLNGQQCTGEIYTISTGVPMADASAPHITIAPNPSTGLSTVDIMLPEQADLNFELFDPAGRRIWQQARPSSIGRHVEQLAMQHLADGVYLLQVHIGDRLSTHRVVLGGGRY